MALAKDRNTQMKDGKLISVPVKTGVTCFAGGLAVASAGFAAPGTAALNLTYLGRFEETVDNAGGADGDVSVLIRRKQLFKWKNDASIAQADVGGVAYIVDDETVSDNDAVGTLSAAGVIVAVDADGVWVE